MSRGVTPYRFLLDESVKHLKPEFPRKRAVTIAEAGLRENAADAQIVELACAGEYIIVTANGRDFEREIRKHQRKMMINHCHDLSGLLILPDGAMVQKRALKRLGERLRFGGKELHWEQVRSGNFLVRATKSGGSEIRRFPRCVYCKKAEATK